MSGAPGLTIGVIHEAKTLHEDDFEYCDAENKLEVDRDTVFLIASLIKGISAAAVGIHCGSRCFGMVDADT